MALKELKATVEALIFACIEPITIKNLAELTETSTKEVQWVISELQKEYLPDSRGIELVALAEGFSFVTKAVHEQYIHKLLSERKAAPLSYAALETLAIIAYKQPVTRSEIEKIRGVSADRTVQTLIERQLIRETGRLDSPGRPITYATTKDFLIHFGLENLEYLPALEVEESLLETTPGIDDNHI